MKVVLVRPNYMSHIITPPLGLGYLSSWLRKHGIDTVLIDALRDRLSPKALIRRILLEEPDAVGITCLTAWYHETVALSRAQFLILDVLPGSELFGTLEGQFTPDWSKQSYREPEWIPAGVTREMLQKAQSRAFRRFYLRPGIFLRMLRHFHISQLMFVVKRLAEYRVMGG